MADSLDPELLRELILKLQEINSSLRVVGNTDRIVAAIGKLSVSMQQKQLSAEREQAAIVKFGKSVDQATDRMKANQQALDKLEDSADQTNTALNNLGANATATAQKLNRAEQIRESGNAMRDARREQWREKEITSAGQLINEYQKGAGVTQILRDRLETVGGTSMTLNVSARMAAAALEGFGKSLLQYAKAVYAGEQGALVAAKSVTTFAEQVGTAATIIGTALMFIPGLGVAARLGGAALSALGIGAKAGAKAMELAAEQSDRMYDSFVTVSKAGVTGSDGMLGLAESAQRLGYGLDQVGIAAFNQLMTEASRDLALMSGSAREGRKSFERFSGDIVKSETGRQLMMLGYSVDDINQGAAGFVKQQVALGLAQRKSQAELTAGAAQYIQQLDAVTKLTGIQRRDLEAQMDANRRNERFRAAIEKVRREQGETAAQNLEYNMAVVSERFPELSKGLQDIAAGFVDTEEAQKVFRSGMAHIPGLMTQGLGSGFQELSQAAKLTTDSMGTLAEVGAFGPVFGSYYEQLKAAGMSEEDAAKRAREIMLDQKKGADAAVQSQVDLRRSQMDTRDALQSLVRDGITPATKALRKLAGLPEEIAETMVEPRAAGGEFNRGTAPEMGPATGVPEAVPEKPMERNAVEEGARSVGSVLQSMGLGPKAGIQPAAPAATTPTEPAAAFRLDNLLNFTAASGSRRSFMDLQADIKNRVLEAAAEYKQATGKKLTINSARRSGADQMRLWQESVKAGRPGIGPTGMPIARPGTSSHELGVAVDIQEYRDAAAVSALNRAGLFQRVPKDPVHFSMARGGIAHGPGTGYPATLHGTEAVVPLPDGRAIPVKITVPEINNPFADSDFSRDTPDIGDAVEQMSQQIRQAITDVMRNYANNPAVESALQELVSLQRSNNSTQERLLQSSVN